MFDYRNAIENTKVPKKLQKAYEKGLDYNQNEQTDYKKCFNDYTWCPYSAETMMKFISFNKVLFG